MLQPTEPSLPGEDAELSRRGPVARVVDWLEDPRRAARRGEKRRRKLDGGAGPAVVKRPPVAVARACETCGLEIPEERLRALPEATQCLDCRRGGDSGPRGSWNLRQLERLAAQHASPDVAQQEEWRFLLTYLEELADEHGNLSPDFDLLVRQSFGDVLVRRS